MANETAEVSGIATASIFKVNHIPDALLKDLSAIELAGHEEEHTLIATLTASSSATLAFESNIDSTYSIYEFRYYNLHPATDNAKLQFQVNTSYNRSIHNGVATLEHTEADSTPAHVFNSFAGDTIGGLSQDAYDGGGTGYANLTGESSNAADASVSGVLRIYSPSSTTFYMLFTGWSQQHGDAEHRFTQSGGYVDMTAAVDKVGFKFSSGNIDSGVIKMYGIKPS